MACNSRAVPSSCDVLRCTVVCAATRGRLRFLVGASASAARGGADAPVWHRRRRGQRRSMCCIWGQRAWSDAGAADVGGLLMRLGQLSASPTSWAISARGLLPNVPGCGQPDQPPYRSTLAGAELCAAASVPYCSTGNVPPSWFPRFSAAELRSVARLATRTRWRRVPPSLAPHHCVRGSRVGARAFAQRPCVLCDRLGVALLVVTFLLLPAPLCRAALQDPRPL